MKRLICLSIVTFSCANANAAIAFVSKSTGTASASASTVSNIARTPHTAGNLLVACVAFNSIAVHVNSIANEAADTWTKCTAGSIVGANDTLEIWYTQSTAGASLDSSTATLSGSAAFRSIFVYEYSGAATVGGCETGANVSGTGPSVTSGSFSPAVTGNVNVACGSFNGGATWSAGTNYTQRNATSAPDREGEDRLGAPSGSQTASVTSGGSAALILGVASFALPSAGSGCSGPFCGFF